MKPKESRFRPDISLATRATRIANGNLTRKTDARGIVINYTYDELNRNRTVDYSNTAVNPDITRVYDNPAPGAYGRGKFWHDYAGGDFNNGQNVEHKSVDSYDALGRPLSVRRHYNSRGQLFDVRLGTDSNSINDGPNPAQWTGASWNRGALRSFFSSNLIEYAWPAVSPQANNGNLYRQDHFVPTALDGDGNVTA